VHIKAEGLGKPLAFVLTEGERHESPVFEKLMKLGGVRRKEVGRPRFRPKFLAADRAYANHRVRGWLRKAQEDTAGHPQRRSREEAPEKIRKRTLQGAQPHRAAGL
jgi:hypothetical protein